MRGERSRRGGSSTTRSGHTAAWDTKPRKSLLLLRPQASTPLSERQGTQTPSLAPRAPPSRLKPEREQLKVVVFLRERKQGAGQHHHFFCSRFLNEASELRYGIRQLFKGVLRSVRLGCAVLDYAIQLQLTS